MSDCPKCKERFKEEKRGEELDQNLLKRLNRISGQINGVKTMVSENRYCADILMQISAIESALKEVGYIVLKNHLSTCVASDIVEGNYDSIDEAIELIRRMK